VLIIMDKVKQAAALLEKEGAAGLPKFKGKGSEFIFNGTYIWVHGLDGKMIMHPIKPALVGQDVLSLKDAEGKKFFEEMNVLVEKNGEGWVEYRWPKPGMMETAKKVSYVHGATLNGQKIVVGCGVYDLCLQDVEAALQASDAQDAAEPEEAKEPGEDSDVADK
jgi:signal transduction histidine kinase